MPTRFRRALAQEHKDWLDGAANALLASMEAEGGRYVDMQTLVRHNGVLVCLVYEVGDDTERIWEPTDAATQEAMRAAHAAGVSFRQIARTHGVSVATVQRHVRKGKDT